MSEQRLIDAVALKKTLEGAGFGDHSLIESVLAAGVYAGIDDAPTIDAVPVVRCRECKHRGSPYACPMRKLVIPVEGPGAYEDCTEDEGYCHKGERMIHGGE